MNRSRRSWLFALLLLAQAPAPVGSQSPPQSQRTLESPSATVQQPAARPIVIGSKPFGESYLLAEVFAQMLEARGIAVIRRPGLGGTEILFPALVRGDIDVYPEYTGSGLRVILKQDGRTSPADVFDTVSRAFASTYDLR